MEVVDLEQRSDPGAARFGMPLSPRETEALHELSYGHNYDAIADRMHITPWTVKSHLKRVFVKLGARNGPHAVGLGYRSGILTGEENQS